MLKSRQVSTMDTGRLSRYRLEGAEIVASRRCLVAQGEVRELRPKTYDLLLFLVENRDRVVSKDEIFREVWGGAAVSDNALVQSVSEIRRSLGDDSKNSTFIKTVSKHGYQFIGTVNAEPAAIRPSDQVLAVREEAEPAQDLPLQPLADRRTNKRRWMAWSVAAALAMVLFATTARFRSPTPGAEASKIAVGWWKLDGDATDASGRSNDARVEGKPRWIPGEMGQALLLDGLETRVSGRGMGFPQGAAASTIAAWIQATSNNGQETPIFSYGSRRMELNYQTVGLLLNGKPSFLGLTGSKPLFDGTWHHIAAVYRTLADGNGTASLYVDGKPEAERIPVKQARVAGSLFCIGCYNGYPGVFRGAIDDVRLYPRPLSSPEVSTLYRCSAGITDVVASGANYFFLPIGEWHGDFEETGVAQNTGISAWGIQLRALDPACALPSMRGTRLPQDLHMEMDLTVAGDAQGRIFNGGPYFRSRAAYPGDGIIGGQSAGYTVQLASNGLIRVRGLNPYHVFAFSTPSPGFAASVPHHLEVTVAGDRLQVWLDRELRTFEEHGALTTTVRLPPTDGDNQGTAGVFFAPEPQDRAGVSGQRVWNLRLSF